MRIVKIGISIMLSMSLLVCTACGSKNSADLNEENVVEVDFGNVDMNDTYSSQNNEPVESYDLANVSENVQDESEIEDEIELEDESNTDSENQSDTNKIISKKSLQSEPEPETDASENNSWFDDCVFMGDSLTLGLSMYNDSTGRFGKAEFVCSAGLGWHNSQWDLFDENEVHPLYYGEKVLLEDAVMLTGANKAIIGLGMNDIGIYGVEDSIYSAGKFLERLRAKSPDVQIYLQTVTPMIPEKEYAALNNSLIQQYNQELKIFAEQHDCTLINSWAAIADENGELPYDFCEDPKALGLHLTHDGCDIWANCIMAAVQ